MDDMATKILSSLRQLPLTSHLDEAHKRKLATMGRPTHFSALKTIYGIGLPGTAIYIVQRGAVIIEMPVPGQGMVQVNKVGPNEWFGWSALFPIEQRGSKIARTLTETETIAFKVEELNKAMQTDVAFDSAIIRCATQVMMARMTSARRQLVDLLAQTT